MAAILGLYAIGYLYHQNNLTNEFLDLKLVEKEVLVEIFGQIVQYTIFLYVIWRPFWIRLVAELCPASQMSTLVIFIGDWSLYMKLLRNIGYIKMYTVLWSRDRTISQWFIASRETPTNTEIRKYEVIHPGPRSKRNYGHSSVVVVAPRLWNKLPLGIREAKSVTIFAKNEKHTFLH